MVTANNIFCTCGHDYGDHSHAKYPMQENFRSEENCCYGRLNPTFGFLCSCFDFKQDNLRYLQEKYESKVG